MKRVVAVVIIHLIFAGAGSAQAQTAENNSPPISKTTAANNSAAQTAEAKTWPLPGIWSFQIRLANVFDSNINRDEEELNSYGFTPGLRVHFQNRESKPWFEFSYEVGAHTYTKTDKWDRVSHNFRTSASRSVTKRLEFETRGEISIKGTSEDRELSNQYTLQQEIKYRLARRTRLNLFGAYRLKRYDQDTGSDSINPYIGIELEQRFSGGRTLELAYRYDKNRPLSPRRRYIRWSYSAEFTTPLGKRDKLELEVKYRPKLYERQVKVGKKRVPRHDHKWTWSAIWSHALRENLALELGYEFERRSSNDPDKRYQAHQMVVGFVYRW